MSPDAAQLRQLAAWLAETDIDLLELSGPGLQLRLGGRARAPASVAPPAAVTTAAASNPATSAATNAATNPALEPVRSPGVGLWLSTHPMRSTPLVAPGQVVQAGQVVGLLRVGPLLTPVHAPCDGQVQALLVAEGSAIGYGTAVLSLSPLLPRA